METVIGILFGLVGAVSLLFICYAIMTLIVDRKPCSSCSYSRELAKGAIEYKHCTFRKEARIRNNNAWGIVNIYIFPT